MIVLFIIIVLLLFSFMLASFIINFKDYKYYKKTYKILSNYKYCINNNQVYGILDYNKKIEFVWFIDSNDFQLTKDIYLHNAFFVYFDFYYLYWLLKYRKWFEKNINLNTIEKY